MRRSGYAAGRSKRGAVRPSSNLPAEHGPRETLASSETPAQVPRHQPARHPQPRVHPPERLNAYRGPQAFRFSWAAAGQQLQHLRVS